MSVKVETSLVRMTAMTLQKYNNQINSDFFAVEKAIQLLNDVWDGNASDKALNVFFQIKKTYYEPRYMVMQSYTKFLLDQVSENYERVENDLVSIASAFK